MLHRSAAVLAAAVLALGLSTASAAADDGVYINPLWGTGTTGNGVGVPGGGGPNAPSGGVSPGSLALFLCPGVGGSVNVLGGGGGYCDFGFLPGAMGHIHCEFGGFAPFANVWQCWRVFRGQPDHPRLPDPDIIPDGMGVPWAIQGPAVDDQWPPEGLAPGAELLAPPPLPDAPPPDPFAPPPPPDPFAQPGGPLPPEPAPEPPPELPPPPAG